MYTTLHKSTQLYKTPQTLQDGTKNLTKLFTTFFNTLHMFTKHVATLYATVQTLYTIVRTILLHNSAQFYNTLQNFTKLYTTLTLFYNT